MVKLKRDFRRPVPEPAEYVRRKKMTDIFVGVSDEDRNRMLGCLSSFTKRYKKNETVEDLNFDSKLSCLVRRGRCALQKIDSSGNMTIPEIYEPGDIFGRDLLFSKADGCSLIVSAMQNCEVTFFDARKLMQPCSNKCPCHITFINNLLSSILGRGERMAAHAEILGQKTMRDKLLAYFSRLSKRQQSTEIQLSVSFAEIADYLAVNRSAMMREIKKMKDDGIIDVNKKTIVIKNP